MHEIENLFWIFNTLISENIELIDDIMRAELTLKQQKEEFRKSMSQSQTNDIDIDFYLKMERNTINRTKQIIHSKSIGHNTRISKKRTHLRKAQTKKTQTKKTQTKKKKITK